MADAERPERLVEEPRDVSRAIFAHHPLGADAVGAEPSQRPDQEACGGGSTLVRQQLGPGGKATAAAIGFGRRNFLEPVPRFESFEALNARLEEQCLARQDAMLRGHAETIGERLLRDLDALMVLPAASYDACEKVGTRATSLSMVRYRGNDYSCRSLTPITRCRSAAISVRWSSVAAPRRERQLRWRSKARARPRLQGRFCADVTALQNAYLQTCACSTAFSTARTILVAPRPEANSSARLRFC